MHLYRIGTGISAVAFVLAIAAAAIDRYYDVKPGNSDVKTYMGVYTYDVTRTSPDAPASYTGNAQLLSCEHGFGSTFSDATATSSCTKQCETRKSLQAIGLVAWYTGLVWSCVGPSTRTHHVIGAMLSLTGVLCVMSVLAIFGYGQNATESITIADTDDTIVADTFHPNFGVCAYKRTITASEEYDGNVYPVGVTTDTSTFADSMIIGITAVCLGGLSATATVAAAILGDNTGYKVVDGM